MPSWPTSFEKYKILQKNPDKLQFKGSKIETFLLDTREIAKDQAKINQSLCVREALEHILNLCKQNFPVCHKKSQNSTVLAVSYSGNCTKVWQL